jgi:site-specific DNA-cytosine methylase
MKKEHELVISNYMGVHPIEINSALVSAQNRKRLYWTNVSNEPYGLFGDMQCVIPQPKDKGILLKDVLESEVDEKYYLSEKMVKYLKQNSVKQKGNGNGFAFSPHVNLEVKGKSITTKEGSRMDDNFVAVNCDGKECTDKSGPVLSRYHKGVSNFGSDTFIKITEDYKIRRLTPIECERLQTAPDNYTKEASDTQRYRMLGNGWTVDVIVHVLKYIKQTK